MSANNRDFIDFLISLFRRKKIFFLILLFILAYTTYFVKFINDTYSFKTSLKISDQVKNEGDEYVYYYFLKDGNIKKIGVTIIDSDDDEIGDELDNCPTTANTDQTDLDEDGDIDIVGAATLDNDIAWFENNGSEFFTEHTIDGDLNGAWDVHIIDMDGDGDLDIAAAGINAAGIVWYNNNGSESFIKNTIQSSINGSSVYPVDLDGDARSSTAPDIGADEFTPPACATPSSLTFGSIYPTSASVSWIGASSAFELEWGLTGFTQGTAWSKPHSGTCGQYNSAGCCNNKGHDVG